MKYFVCAHCGNIVTYVKDSGVKLVCCGQKMEELVPGSVEASVEKHLPVVSVEGGLVRAFVGSAEHPMAEEHFIEWLSLETDKGEQRKVLRPGEKPEVVFALTEGETPKAVYAYCNLHGLWKTDI